MTAITITIETGTATDEHTLVDYGCTGCHGGMNHEYHDCSMGLPPFPFYICVDCGYVRPLPDIEASFS